MTVSTQTSRSVVVRTRARVKNKQNEVTSSLPSKRPSRIVEAVLGNVTRASPSGVKRLPSHRFNLSPSQQRVVRKKVRKDEVESRSIESPTTTSSRQRPLKKVISDGHVVKADQVVKAPPSMEMDDGASGRLVVIRSYCRFKPPAVDIDSPRCRRRKEPLYYYDVQSAKCLPFYGGNCSRSRNRFVSPESCLASCIVEGLRGDE